MDPLSAIAELERTPHVALIDQTRTRDFVWREYALSDEATPLTIDVVVSSREAPRRVIYLLPGGGTNFRAAFFSPESDNLAQFYREQGYLVVGITPREENLADPRADLSFTQGWGIAKHREDIRRVVSAVQRSARLPYEVLGHSYGAVSALDYASHFSGELTRVVALDIYSIDPARDAPGIANAEKTYQAHLALLGQGVYVDPANAGAGRLALLTPEQLKADSGYSREALGLPGNFTNEGLIYFASIFTRDFPGIHTDITGLTGDWPLVQSTFAGSYSPQTDPAQDSWSLGFVPQQTLLTASSRARSGLIPLAFARDYWAVVARNPAFQIDWSAIKSELIWLNSELGYGDQTYGASQVRSAGNRNVTVSVIAGYGHGDLLLGKRARKDVWKQLR